MSWKPEAEEIARRKRLALEMGGPDAVERQHGMGRLTIRERITGLVDPDSFAEQGPQAGSAEVDDAGELVSFTPANYVLGLARIGGRPCAIGGEDFTQRGGSPSSAGLRKSVFAEEIACRYQVPLVRFLEGGGGSITGTRGKSGSGPSAPVGDPFYAPHRFASIARVLREVPVVSAAVGPVAGFPAARLAASHLAIMVHGTSQVLIGGPALVQRALGEDLTKEELGGSKVHLRSGVVDIAARDEEEVFEIVRRFLSYLPSNSGERAPRQTEDVDNPGRCEESLLEIIPRDRRKVYAMRDLVSAVVDRDSFFEMTALYGRSQITGLARLNGHPVGIWANDPYFYAGSMDATGAQKVARFLRLCETFHLPIVAFVDEPGFLIGQASEAAGTIRYGVDAIVAAMESTVPWASVIVRKTYGVAAAAHFGPQATIFSWPSAEGGALPLEGGVAVAFRKEIAAAPDPDALRAELEEKFASRRTPFPRAESFGVQDLLDPRQTRPALCDWLEWNQAALRRRTSRGQPPA